MLKKLVEVSVGFSALSRENGTDIFPQDGFLGFIFGLPGGQAGSGILSVGVIEAALAAPLRPILPFGDAVAGAFQQVDLVEAGILAKLHDLGAEVPQHGRRTAVLAAFLPIAGLFHVGPAFDFSDTQTANHDMNMDVARAVVTVRVGADERRVAWKIFLAELQAQGLRLFQGQAIVHSVPRIKADDVVMSLYITGLCVFAVFSVCQQEGHGEGVLPTIQRIQQIIFAEFGLAVLVQNG